MLNEEQAMAWAENLMVKISLTPLACPTCSVKFGMQPEDLRFAEQTGEQVHCPRGHKMVMRLGTPTSRL